MIRHYTENNVSSGFFLSGDRILAYEISGFSIQKGGPVRGWLIDIRDATEERKNLEILTDYNNRLNREVAEKTRNIEAIQEKLVLSMADMVENGTAIPAVMSGAPAISSPSWFGRFRKTIFSRWKNPWPGISSAPRRCMTWERSALIPVS